MLFNLNGLLLTKHVSAMFRAFWDATRVFIVWVVSLIAGLEPFHLESFFIELAGCFLLILGNFIYNEIIELPCFGLNKSLKKYDVPKSKKRGQSFGKSMNSSMDQGTKSKTGKGTGDKQASN